MGLIVKAAERQPIPPTLIVTHRLTLAQAAARIDIDGRPAKVADAYRFAAIGLLGVKLHTLQDPDGELFTTRDAVRRFLDAVGKRSPMDRRYVRNPPVEVSQA